MKQKVNIYLLFEDDNKVSAHTSYDKAMIHMKYITDEVVKITIDPKQLEQINTNYFIRR